MMAFSFGRDKSFKLIISKFLAMTVGTLIWLRKGYPLLGLRVYRDEFGLQYRNTVTSIAALDQQTKSTGIANNNHLAYIQLSPQLYRYLPRTHR